MATLEKKADGSQKLPVAPVERFFNEGLFGSYELMFPTIATVRRAMDSMFDAMMAPDIRSRFGSGPLVDIYEKDGNYVVDCAVPGFKKDDVKVEVVGNALTISGEVTEQKKEEKAQYHRRELRHESFSRTIDFPQEIDPDKVSASFENGMLKVTLPPAKKIERKAITIGG